MSLPAQPPGILPGLPGPAASPSFLDKVKFLQEHLKIVLTLSTGSLVLSVSLLQKLTEMKGKESLHAAWLLLFVSILAGVASNYFLTMQLNSGKDWYASLVAFLSFVLHCSFIAAMVYFLRFAFANF